jgi:hypothetical protein
MNRTERIERIKESVRAQKAVPAKEGFINASTLTGAFTIIIIIALSLLAAFLAYKFLLPFVVRGSKRVRNAIRYSK